MYSFWLVTVIHADISMRFWTSGAPLQVADATHATAAVDAANAASAVDAASAKDAASAVDAAAAKDAVAAKDAKDVKVVPLASSPATAPAALGGWVTRSWNTNEVCYPSCILFLNSGTDFILETHTVGWIGPLGSVSQVYSMLDGVVRPQEVSCINSYVSTP